LLGRTHTTSGIAWLIPATISTLHGVDFDKKEIPCPVGQITFTILPVPPVKEAFDDRRDTQARGCTQE
jgi:hypothetical protein